MTEAAKKRLFFALPITADCTRQIAHDVVPLFRSCGGRPVAEANWHITLAYFGAADAVAQQCLQQQADTLEATAFELVLDRCGFWSRPKVAWLGASTLPDALQQLCSQLQQTLVPCGFQPESRLFQPHITLIRKARRAPAMAKISPITLPVTDFCLYQSVTQTEGVVYKKLKSWALLPR